MADWNGNKVGIQCRVSAWTWGCDERMYLGKKQKIPALGHLGSPSVAARVVINSQIQVLCVLSMFLERASQVRTTRGQGICSRVAGKRQRLLIK